MHAFQDKEKSQNFENKRNDPTGSIIAKVSLTSFTTIRLLQM